MRRETNKLAIKRCISQTARKKQTTYTQGWSEGRKRASQRLKLVAKKGITVVAGPASAVREASVAAANDPKQKRKAVVLDQQARQKDQEDVFFLSGSSELRLAEVAIQEHEIAVRVPSYVVNEVEQSIDEEEELDWIIGVVLKSYIEEQSNTRMYEVFLANGVTKCIPSGFTKHILKELQYNLQISIN